ncbi:MAG: type I DNA topoisomerase [Clostridia bacterium]|nr:type I DNA topoisomerase [Clostridia bacterium]
MKLVVIEGAGKVKTVEKYLGKGFKVFATKGHIRDLPVKSLAVNVAKNFEPHYEILPDKTKMVDELRKLASSAEEIYLATDPDREGEAISWHIATVLGLDSSKKVRIEFNEISQKAVQRGLENPREINLNLVDAQQARRVLDRLVGYKISPVLCKKIQNNLSAGRVQSVTLRLIVEREREIRAFKPEEYWPFYSIVKNGDSPEFRLALEKKNKKKFTLKNKEEVEFTASELNNLPYIVSSVKKTVTKSHAPAPFITSSMQQDALNKLGMDLKTTSKAAQSLYEGVDIPGEGKVALITYIRTDSTRVSPEAQTAARDFIAQKYGKDFIPEKPNFYASKKSAQDAHEAIRPITLTRTPESLDGKIDKNLYRLYKLIYDRFLASQMSEARYNSVVVEVGAGAYGFKVTGKTPVFKGFTVVYSAYTEEKEEEQTAKLPEINEGDILTLVNHKFEQKYTKPPTRYTEASLVKLREEKGIGRPATYVPTVTLILSRHYVEKEGKYLVATKLGEDVTDMLVRYFPDVMDVKFTATMEEKLDDIEFGGKIWQKVIAEFYDGFEDKIAEANGDSFSLKDKEEVSSVICERCGAHMVVRSGKFGKFLACPNFPKCKNTKDLDENGEVKERAPKATYSELAPVDDDFDFGFDEVISLGALSSPKKSSAQTTATEPKKQVKKAEKKETQIKVDEQNTASGEICEKCGRPMVEKTGRYGKFLACSGYPECKNIRNTASSVKKKEPSEVENEDYGKCPTCGKELKKLTKGKTVFYGCTGYPDCKFTSFDPVAEGKCPTCGKYLVVHTYKNGKVIKCSNRECDYKREVKSES